MEVISSNKRRSFMKSKLLPTSLSKVMSKSFPIATHHSSCKVKPLPSPVWPDSATTLSKHSQYTIGYTPPIRGSTATVVNSKLVGHNDSRYHSFYGLSADENVDAKAASYISNVRERFKLERFDLDQSTKRNEVY